MPAQWTDMLAVARLLGLSALGFGLQACCALGLCYDDDACAGKAGACGASEYCATSDGPEGGSVEYCRAFLSLGSACGLENTWPCTSRGVSSSDCEVELAEQCGPEASCTAFQLNGFSHEVCASGGLGSPCLVDGDCGGAEGLLCPRPEWNALASCVPAHTKAAGTACDRSDECVEGLTCRAADCSSARLCVAPAALEEDCCREGDCEAELSCLTFERRPYCWRAGDSEAGEICDTDRHCAEGLACVVEDRWASAGVCRAPGESGAFCQEDRHCQSGLRCVELDAGRCSSGQLGAPCAVNQDCEGELVCEQSSYVCFAR